MESNQNLKAESSSINEAPSNTPPPIVHYSSYQSSILMDKLKNEETFSEGLMILATWLNRGVCNKKNSTHFYVLIQNINNHVRQLINEKIKKEEELNRAKMACSQRIKTNISQFDEIQRFYDLLKIQKNWDNFSKAQHKKIDLWKQQTQQFKNAHIEELLKNCIENEIDIDLSDNSMNENTINKYKETIINFKSNELMEELNKYRKENYNLKCQLKAAKHELEVLQNKIDKENFNYICTARAFQNLVRTRLPLRNKFETADDPQPKRKKECKIDAYDFKNISDKEHQLEGISTDNISSMERNANPFPQNISKEQIRIVALISVFLNVHPFGADIEYIYSYIKQFECDAKEHHISSLMNYYPYIFKEITTVKEKKWLFIAFNNQ